MDKTIIESRMRAAGVSRMAWSLTLPKIGQDGLRGYVSSGACSSGLAYIHPGKAAIGPNGNTDVLTAVEVTAKELVLFEEKLVVLDYLELHNFLINDKEWSLGDASDIYTSTNMIVIRDFVSHRRVLDINDYGIVCSWVLRRHYSGVGIVLGGDSPLEVAVIPESPKLRLLRESTRFIVNGAAHE